MEQLPPELLQILMQMVGNPKQQKARAGQQKSVDQLLKLILDPAMGQLTGTDFGSEPQVLPYQDQTPMLDMYANDQTDPGLAGLAQGLKSGQMTPLAAIAHLRAEAKDGGQFAYAKPVADASGKMDDSMLQTLISQVGVWGKELSDNTKARQQYEFDAVHNPEKVAASQDMWQKAGLPSVKDQYTIDNVPLDEASRLKFNSSASKYENDLKALQEFQSQHRAPVNPGGLMFGNTSFPARPTMSGERAPTGGRPEGLTPFDINQGSPSSVGWGDILTLGIKPWIEQAQQSGGGADAGADVMGVPLPAQPAKVDKGADEKRKQMALRNQFLADSKTYEQTIAPQEMKLKNAAGRSKAYAQMDANMKQALLNDVLKRGRTPLLDAFKLRANNVG
jgi:transposase-like protein